MKEKSKTPERDQSNEEIANLFDGEFKALVIKYSQKWLSMVAKWGEK